MHEGFGEAYMGLSYTLTLENQPMVPARCACIAVSAYAKCSQCNPSMRMGGTSNARPLHHSTQHMALFSLDINLINFECCTPHLLWMLHNTHRHSCQSADVQQDRSSSLNHAITMHFTHRAVNQAICCPSGTLHPQALTLGPKLI